MLLAAFISSLFGVALVLFGLNTILHMPFLVSSIIVLTIVFAVRFTNFTKINFRILATLKYIIWLIKEVFISAITVAIKAWQPESQLSSCFRKISVSSSKLATVVYANSITLTPGTITVEIFQNEYLVHALNSESISDLETGIMENNIKKFIN